MGVLAADLGRLDVLPGSEPVGDYARLRSRAASMQLDDGEHPIIALDDLIAVNEHVGRPKDVLVAAQLRAVRARMRHSSSADDDGGPGDA